MSKEIKNRVIPSGLSDLISVVSMAIVGAAILAGRPGPGYGAAAARMSHARECAGQEIQIREKDGVTLVKNPDHPVAVPGEPGKLRLALELTIGKESDPEEAMIFTLRDLQVDGRGNIYVLDDKVDLIKVYGADGAHIRTIGRKGPGPREFGSLSIIAISGAGNLYVYDIGNHRVAEYSTDGRCLSETPFTKWRPFHLVPDSRGFAYGELLDMERGVTELLVKFDRNLEKIATPATLTIASNPSESMVPMELFRLLFQVDREDRLVWASMGEFTFHVVDADGKPMRTIERECRPRGYTREDKARLEKYQFGDKGPPQGAELFYPPHRPVLESFIIDDQGRIYGRTYDKDPRGEIYHDVFDKEGRFFCRFTVPEEERLWVVKGSKAYCAIRESKEGIPQVKRYAMVWE